MVLQPQDRICKYGGYNVWKYDPDCKLLYCKLCCSYVSYKRKSLLDQHARSSRHKKNVDIMNNYKGNKESLDRPDFQLDLARMLVVCNIPLANVEKREFIKFIEKYCCQRVPSRVTMCTHLSRHCTGMLKRIKEKLRDVEIFLQAVELNDALGRAMIAILVGSLDGVSLEQPFLIDVGNVVRANDENKQSIQEAVVKALHKVFGDDLNYKKVRLVLTGGASHCLKSGYRLMQEFPNLLHSTCLLDALNPVAELVWVKFPKVKCLVSEIKTILSFNKGHELSAGTSATWLETALFYLENFQKVKTFLEGKEDGNSVAFSKAKELIRDKEILPQLGVIKTNFSILAQTMKALQERIPLIKSVELIEELRDTLILQPFADKLNKLLQENPSYDKIMKIAQVLRGSEKEFEGHDANEFAFMKNAPLAKSNVESVLKEVITPIQGRYTEGHIKDTLLVKWNSTLNA